MIDRNLSKEEIKEMLRESYKNGGMTDDRAYSPTKAVVGMGKSLMPWKCSCGKVNNSRFCEDCGRGRLWHCVKCRTANTGKFCTECGSPKPWVCGACGTYNIGKFCTDCGASKAEGIII